ncbi:hypothetical protein ACJJTC_010324 [Scirpophaga incertulas]
MMKDSNPLQFDNIMALESHLEDRINTPLYMILKANLVTFIIQVLGMSFDEETILKVASILDTNTFDVRLPDASTRLRAIYVTASMMNHSCKPNTRHVIIDNDHNFAVIATVPISKGEMITTTYTQTLWGTLDRRQHLRSNKCFDSVKCFWGNKALSEELRKLKKDNPLQFEDFITKYSQTLHPNNHLVVQAKLALVQIYGNCKGCTLSELPDELLKRKIDLCNELLELADILEPGWSRFRGTLLLDLQAAMTVQTKRDFEADKITKGDAQGQLMESMTLLQEAANILKVEPDMRLQIENKIKNLARQLEDAD